VQIQKFKKKLIEEIKTNIRSPDDFTKDESDSLVFLTNCVKETLRLAPPVRSSIPRENEIPVNFGGYNIPVGSQVCYTTYALHHSDKYWKNPEKFDPDRWLPENAESNSNYIGFIPFMLGSRNCIGQHVALMELNCFLVDLFSRYSVELGDPNYQIKWKASWVVCPENISFKFVEHSNK